MSELTKRALTGAAYVAVTIGSALAGPWTTLLVFLPVGLVAAHELHRLQWAGTPAPSPIVLLVLTGMAQATIAASAFVPQVTLLVVVAVLTFLAIAGLTLVLLRGGRAPLQEAGLVILTLAYIALPFGLITHLLVPVPAIFIGFMVMLWTNDTGAYLVGRAMGRTKLLPSVSPKKTVEGLIGGILLTVLAAWCLHHWQPLPVLSLVQWCTCAVAVAITATIGDLLESAFKRAAGVKDSGNVLPGHGGILDRFDGFLLAAPAMLLTVLLLA